MSTPKRAGCRYSFATWVLCLALLPTVHARGPVFELVSASAETLSTPHDIVLSSDGTRLYVADNGNHRIVVLDAATLSEIGTFGEGELREPHDVDFDGQGRLLVADTGNSRIAIYAIDTDVGKLVGSLEGRMRRPEGVAAHPDGRVLVTGAGSNNLVIFSGNEVSKEVGGFASPHDIAIDAAGHFWVADANNDRLVQLDTNLATIRVLFGTKYSFNGPRYLDFDAQGRLFVADKYSHQIKVIAPDGSLITTIGTANAGKGPGLFDRPEGVEIREPFVWFADTYNNRIVRYRMRN